MNTSPSVCGNALDKDLVQRAVMETAFAYYRKGPKIQYDSTELSTEDRESTGVSRLSTGDSPEMTGDIFLCLSGDTKLSASNPTDVVTYIYLGEERVAVCSSEGTKITSFEETLARAVPMNVVIGLRPSLAFDSLT